MKGAPLRRRVGGICMEHWDLYDIDRKKTGRTIARGAAFKAGDYHLAVHICLFNTKGEMLIQQRQPFKDGWPNRWDLSAAGSALKGETSQAAAQRELWEELGLAYDFQNFRPQLTVNFDEGFDDIYILVKDVVLEALTLQPEEVQCVRWASAEEIIAMISSGAFIPYYPSLVQLIFDGKDRYGGYLPQDS